MIAPNPICIDETGLTIDGILQASQEALKKGRYCGPALGAVRPQTECPGRTPHQPENRASSGCPTACARRSLE
jgi:hypothetical protein